MTEPPTPREMTAEEVRDSLAAGNEVWLWEKDSPRHKVHSVEPLTVDQAELGQDYKIYFRGAMTGNMCRLQVNSTAKVMAVARRPPAAT